MHTTTKSPHQNQKRAIFFLKSKSFVFKGLGTTFCTFPVFHSPAPRHRKTHRQRPHHPRAPGLGAARRPEPQPSPHRFQLRASHHQPMIIHLCRQAAAVGQRLVRPAPIDRAGRAQHPVSRHALGLEPRTPSHILQGDEVSCIGGSPMWKISPVDRNVAAAQVGRCPPARRRWHPTGERPSHWC